MGTAQSSVDGATPSALSSLQATAIARRGEFWMRVLLGLFGAGVVAILCAPLTAGIWVSVMLASQALSRLAFMRFERVEDRRPPSSFEVFFCNASVTLAGLVSTSVTVPLWFEGGAPGQVFAIMWLCGTLVHVTLHTNLDRTMLTTTVGAHMLFFLGLPIAMLALGGPLDRTGALTVLLGALLYSAHLTVALRRTGAARAVLRAARERAVEGQKAAEAASESKSRFLAVMSHELRTPMSGVLGMTRLLLESDLQPRQRQQAESLQDAGEMLLTILNDLIDYSKIEAGAIKLEPSDVDVRRMVSSLASLWRSRAEEKGLRLETLVAADAPAVVVADGQRLRQAISNMLSNAIKRTEKGEIRVEVAAPRGDEDSALLRISVIDTSEGMAPEEAERLFDLQAPADDVGGRRQAGGGLGLAIARQLARLMGGDVLAMSEAGEGARLMFEAELPVADWVVRNAAAAAESGDARDGAFELDDPEIEFEDVTGYEPIDIDDDRGLAPALAPDDETLSRSDELLFGDPEKFPDLVVETVQKAPAPPPRAAAPPPPERPVPAPPPPPRKLQVCVVEDQALNRRVIEAALVRIDCELTFAVDGADALERLQERKYDFIFMDLQMPVYDGYEVTRRLRASGGVNAKTPVIGLTANVLHGVRENCLAAGMDDFITKPIDLRALYQAVSRALEHRQDGHVAERRRA
jgi:signal transduction histidine kinase/ActR/RegA family two-component response regulator